MGKGRKVFSQRPPMPHYGTRTQNKMKRSTFLNICGIDSLWVDVQLGNWTDCCWCCQQTCIGHNTELPLPQKAWGYLLLHHGHPGDRWQRHWQDSHQGKCRLLSISSPDKLVLEGKNLADLIQQATQLKTRVLHIWGWHLYFRKRNNTAGWWKKSVIQLQN